jgi:hypothetical protein
MPIYFGIILISHIAENVLFTYLHLLTGHSGALASCLHL